MGYVLLHTVSVGVSLYKTFIKACLYDLIISVGHTYMELGDLEEVRIINNDPIH